MNACRSKCVCLGLDWCHAARTKYVHRQAVHRLNLVLAPHLVEIAGGQGPADHATSFAASRKGCRRIF